MILKVRDRYYNENNQQVGKEVSVRVDIDLGEIRSVRELYDGKRIHKSKCLLICNPPINVLVVDKSFDKMNRLIEEYNKKYSVLIKGFKRYDETKQL